MIINKTSLLTLFALLMMALPCAGIVGCNSSGSPENSAQSESVQTQSVSQVTMWLDSEGFIGQIPKTVEDEFEEHGFTDVTLIGQGSNASPDKDPIYKLTINDEDSFAKGDKYPSDAEVCIYYSGENTNFNTTTSGSSKNAVNIEWTTITAQQEDEDGYTYDVTYKLSPWILLSDTDIIKAAWDEVGEGEPLPGFNDWGLKHTNNTYTGYFNQNGTSFYFQQDMTDMYYCVGTMSIKNTTPDWDIDASQGRSLWTGLSWTHKKGYVGASSYSQPVGRIYLSDKTTYASNGLSIKAALKGNTWGPVPFIIMIGEEFTPKTPEGSTQEYLLNSFFRTYNTVSSSVGIYGKNDTEPAIAQLGVYGKDGVYTPPASLETEQ